MKSRSLVLVAVALGAALESGQCFQQQSLTTRQQSLQNAASTDSFYRRGRALYANEREDFIPETSFGAEVVPEGQRPVNEYLEMRRSPLFEWASNEVGLSGVSFSTKKSINDRKRQRI